MAFKSGNLSLATVRKILRHQGCKLIRHEKGHEKYYKQSLFRPIVIQDHIIGENRFTILIIYCIL